MDVEKLAAVLAPVVRAEIAKAVQPLQDKIQELESRKPEKGEPGSKGEDGKDAEPVDIDEVASAVISELLSGDRMKTLADLHAASAVEGYMAAHPVRDGRDGEKGERGRDGESPSVEAVADAVSAKFERRFGDLTLSWERQVRDMAEKAIDKMPAPKDGRDGVDGNDGFGLEDLTLDFDGERTVTLKFERGELSKSAVLRFPVPIYRGVYADAKQYEKGDTVTWGGSQWTAQQDAPEGKPGASEHWRLSVKRGDKGPKGDVLTLPATVKVGAHG